MDTLYCINLRPVFLQWSQICKEAWPWMMAMFPSIFETTVYTGRMWTQISTLLPEAFTYALWEYGGQHSETSRKKASFGGVQRVNAYCCRVSETCSPIRIIFKPIFGEQVSEALCITGRLPVRCVPSSEVKSSIGRGLQKKLNSSAKLYRIHRHSRIGCGIRKRLTRLP